MSETNKPVHPIWYFICGCFSVLVLLLVYTIIDKFVMGKIDILNSNDNSSWSCSIMDSNSFGTCLGELAQKLDVTATPTIDTKDACQYAQSRSADTIWLGSADNSLPWTDALERAEYRAQVETGGNYDEVSPARKVLESIGVSYNPVSLGFKTLEADLAELDNDDARKALGDYISSLDTSTPVSMFYIESPDDSGILQRVNIVDRTNITLESEGFKENLIDAHNLTPMNCSTSN